MMISSWIFGTTAQQTLFLSPELKKEDAIQHIQSNPLKVIFYFDLHHVLFNHAPSAYFASAKKVKNKPTFLAQAVASGFSPKFWKNTRKLAKQKIKVTEAYLGGLQKDSTLHKGLITFMNDLYVPNKAMENYIARLKRSGHDLYLLSNIGPQLLDDLQKRYPDFFVPFNRRTNTINYNTASNAPWLSKPHVTSYQHAVEITNNSQNPWFCVFVDDKLENINGALKAGLNAILFVSAEQFERDVKLLFEQFVHIRNGVRLQ